MTKTPEQFFSFCRDNNIIIEAAQGSYLVLCKRFSPGDRAAYCMAESDVGVIYEVKSVGPSSVWGTDGGSIGGHVGLTNGYMRLHKSNVGQRWMSKLRKLMSATAAQYMSSND